MEDISLLMIVLGICMLVLQFYMDYEVSGLDKYINKKSEEEIIANYKDKENNKSISFFEKFDLYFRNFFRTKILYKIGAMLLGIGIVLIILF